MSVPPTGSNDCPLCDEEVRLHQVSALNTFFYNCSRCGKFEIGGKLLRTIKELPEIYTNRHILSGYTLESTDSNETALLTVDTAPEIISKKTRLKIDAKARRVLYRIHLRSENMGADVTLDAQVEYPTGYCKGVEEFGLLMKYLADKGFIELDAEAGNVYYCRTTYEGWSEAENLVKELAGSTEVFIAMGVPADETKNALVWAALEEGIVTGLEELGFQPSHRKLADVPRKLNKEAIKRIRESRFVIADYTGHSPLVYAAAGCAVGEGIPVVHLCHKDDAEDWRFDPAEFECILWTTPEQLWMELEKVIKETKELKPPGDA